MEKKYKFLILDILGTFLILFGLISISYAMYNQSPTQILFMCYLGLMIVGMGILTKRSFIILSQVYILLIPHIIWTIDFFYQTIFNKSLWGVTDYVFLEGVPILGNIISLQHIFLMPIALFSIYLLSVKRKDAWKWSFVQIVIVYFLVKLLADPETNINCIFNPCINIYFGLPYRFTWFLLIFGMTFITSVFINSLSILKKNHEKKNHEKKNHEKKLKNKIKKHFREVLELKTSPHSIALGFALGTLIAILPTLGFGIFIGLFILFLFKRISKISLFVAFAIWNPLILALLYPFEYGLGNFLLANQPVVRFKFEILNQLFIYTGRFLIGSFIFSIFLSVLSYFIVFYFVRKHQKRNLSFMVE